MSAPAASASLSADEARPDAALREFAGYALKRAWAAVQADLSATLRPFGLRTLTYSALAVVVARPGLRQSDLADTLAVERPNLVAVLDELAGAGLVVRERDATDRRAQRVRPTGRGLALARRATAEVRAHEVRMFDGLGADGRAALIAALARVEANGAGRR